MTLEKKRALLTEDWTLCVYRPTPENMPESLLWGGSLYWTLSEDQKRDRYYIRPARLTAAEYTFTLYDTEEAALDAWISSGAKYRRLT